jgi:3-methyladenine DNA glycosylase AlkD
MADDEVSNAGYHVLCYDEFEVQPIRQQVNRMKIQDARELGDQLADLVSFQRYEEACDLLSPLLAERTPFRLLDAIGGRLGIGPLDVVNVFLDQVAAQRAMGGWVIIASTQRQQLNRDLPGTFERSYKFVIAADVWYATDTFGERVTGPALVSHLEPSLDLLAPWREDPNCWIRRIVGVSVHYWAKQSRGKVSFLPQARALLDLLNPLFEERCTDAIKGIGWGLKTMGRYYPELVADWLVQQAGRPHRALMLRKATTYLPSDLRQRVTEIHQ